MSKETKEILKTFSVERLKELEKFLQERIDQIGSSRPVTKNQPTFSRDKIDWKEDEREYLNLVKSVLSEKMIKNESFKIKRFNSLNKNENKEHFEFNDKENFIIAIDSNDLLPRVFDNINEYKEWCKEQIENDVDPDELISNHIHEVKKGEKPGEENYIDLHDFHISLYDRK